MKITGAIFDLDGTLVDSMKIWDVVRSFGAEPTDDLAYQLAAMDKQEAADYMIKTFLLPLSREEVLNRVNELVDEEYSSIVPLKKGADVLLEFLHSNKIPCSKRGLSGRAGNEAAGSMGMFPVCAQLYAVRLQKQSTNLLSGSRKNGNCSGTDLCV